MAAVNVGPCGVTVGNGIVIKIEEMLEKCEDQKLVVTGAEERAEEGVVGKGMTSVEVTRKVVEIL